MRVQDSIHQKGDDRGPAGPLFDPDQTSPLKFGKGIPLGAAGNTGGCHGDVR
jgi:hypothetical protein